ncbi:hypothetical protein KW791_01235 [Candidatus Parcubacteria bacterium]|nr:hypothetical protein [Candidatus Parcubacteria bacterium]
MHPALKDDGLLRALLWVALLGAIAWTVVDGHWILFFMGLGVILSRVALYLKKMRLKKKHASDLTDGIFDAHQALRYRLSSQHFKFEHLEPSSAEFKEGFQYRVICASEAQELAFEAEDPRLAIQRCLTEDGEQSEITKVVDILENVCDYYHLKPRYLGPISEPNSMWVYLYVGFGERTA